MMRRFRWLYVLAALVLSACGGNDQLATAPTALPATTSAPLPTDDPNLFRAEPTGAPAATSAPTLVASDVPVPTIAPAATDTPEPVLSATPEPTEQAKPTTAPAAAKPAAPASGAPKRLVIDDIGLDYRPVSVGLDRNNVPVVPNHDVGWYNLGAAPGQGENIVFWGHVLRFRNAPKIPAPFARMKELKVGASVVVYDADGERHNYTVTRTFWVTPDQVEVILPQGKEMVTMVSCIGDKVIQNGEVVDESHRLIVVAEPA